MFKHRLSKFGIASLFAMCMLFVGGSLQSCQDLLDEYPYDDPGDPAWLGASVYDFLKEGTPEHSYQCFVEIIDSLGEKETLAHTGSKTLFVADDEAFERFFNDNPWNVRSVQEMTRAQMKTILYSAMLDNALLLDMLSSTGAAITDEGTCLRRLTSVSVIDTIPLWTGKDMPKYNKFWDALRGKERKDTMRVALDGTDPMMVHFLPEYIKNNAIQASDIEFLFRKGGTQVKTYHSGEAMLFANKIVASGVETDGFSDDSMTITCKNGYIYRLDDVLLPPSNMAEELRNREDTKVFSHLLDRFCIPVYNESLTKEYQGYYKNNDSIFSLRYFVKDRFSTYDLLKANDRPVVDELLAIDPGWNTNANSLAKERDMAAMFVPQDEVLYSYFADADGAGRFLLEQFAPDVEVKDIETLLQALDSVPEVNIAPFLNNLMKPSFAGTVLSKFDKVTDDANDPMGLKEGHVDECVIANNGVIYILNNVFGPATYQAVSAPTIVFDNMLMMRNIIKQLRYDYYLLAMDAKYSFIVPDDAHFIYHDPVTFSTDEPTVYAFHYDKNRPKGNGALELWADKYKFDPRTYQVVDTLTALSGISVSGTNFGGNTLLKNRMTDIMEYLIIVHGNEGQFIPGKKYYQTKGYGTIKVDASDAENVKFYGGEQIENGTYVATGSMHSQKNGITYCTVAGSESETPGRLISGIPTPPTKSVYTNMKTYGELETDPFYEFYQLCTPPDFEATLKLMFPKVKEKNIKEDTMKLYSIFYTSTDGKLVNVVPFFNTFHYTVYVPDNDAVKAMFDKGLPQWEDVISLAGESPAKAASVMRLLNRFLRYHFQDNSVYLDGVPFSIPSPDGGDQYVANFATAVINDNTGRFYETTVKSNDNNSTLVITDHLGGESKIVTEGEEGKTWNVMCRDIEYTVNNSAQKKPTTIATSSFAVIHSVDRALQNDGLFGYDGRFTRFASSGEAVVAMPVNGVNGTVQLNGKNCYLVAEHADVKMIALDGTEKTMAAGYLMEAIDESHESWNSVHTREVLVGGEEGKMLVNSEAMLIQASKDEDGNTIYSYVTETDSEGKDFMLKVDNSGAVIEKIPYENEDVPAEGDNGAESSNN